MKELNAQLLDTIDSIDDIVTESELAVCMELMKGYSKSSMLLEYADVNVLPEYEMYIQEGSIGDFFKSIIEGIKNFFKKALARIGIRKAGTIFGWKMGHEINKMTKGFLKNVDKTKKVLEGQGYKATNIQGDPTGILGTADGWMRFVGDMCGSLTSVTDFLGLNKDNSDGSPNVFKLLSTVAQASQTVEGNDINSVKERFKITKSGLSAAAKQLSSKLTGGSDRSGKALDKAVKDENFEAKTKEETAEKINSNVDAIDAAADGSAEKHKLLAENRQAMFERFVTIIKQLDDFGNKIYEALQNNEASPEDFTSAFFEMAEGCLQLCNEMAQYIQKLSSFDEGSTQETVNTANSLYAKYASGRNDSVKNLKPFVLNGDAVVYYIPQVVKLINMVKSADFSKANTIQDGTKVVYDLDKIIKGQNPKQTLPTPGSEEYRAMLQDAMNTLNKFDQSRLEFESRAKLNEASEQLQRNFKIAVGQLTTDMTNLISDVTAITAGISKVLDYFEQQT